MDRKISQQIRGFRTQDGAVVNLGGVLGNGTVHEYDPILMLDSFDTESPDDYTEDFDTSKQTGSVGWPYSNEHKGRTE